MCEICSKLMLKTSRTTSVLEVRKSLNTANIHCTKQKISLNFLIQTFSKNIMFLENLGQNADPNASGSQISVEMVRFVNISD